MKLELRSDAAERPIGLACLTETPDESKLLDQVFGATCDRDGLLGRRTCECRVADTIGASHYVLIRAEPGPSCGAHIASSVWVQLVDWDARLSRERISTASLTMLRDRLVALVADIVENEREACARIVEQSGARPVLAAMIRARSS